MCRFNHSGVLELNFTSTTYGLATLMYYGITYRGDFKISYRGNCELRLQGYVQYQLTDIKGELCNYNRVMLVGTMKNLRACVDDNPSIVGQLDYVIAEITSEEPHPFSLNQTFKQKINSNEH
jgi:hypothetical protein